MSRLHCLFERINRYFAIERDCCFECRDGLPSVALCHLDEPVACVFGYLSAGGGSAFGGKFLFYTRNNLSHITLRVFCEYEDPTTGEERRNNLEARVLGRSADEGNVAALDKGEEKILLRFVETMYFINKKNDGFLESECAALRDDALDIVFAGFHRGEFVKFRSDRIGIDACECRLATPRRAPQNEREEFLFFDGDTYRLARAGQMFLSDEFVERPWTNL